MHNVWLIFEIFLLWLFGLVAGASVMLYISLRRPLSHWKLKAKYKDEEVAVGAFGFGNGTYIIFMDEFGRSCTVPQPEAEKDGATFGRTW